MSKQGYSNLGNCFHGSPLSFDSESEIQRRVNEMDRVGPSVFHFSLPKANASRSV